MGDNINWDFVKSIFEQHKNQNFPMEVIHKSRKDSVERAYNEWKLKNTETTLYDKIFSNIKEDFVIRLNDFPYNLEENVLHYIVWLNPNQTKYNYNSVIDKNLLNKIKTVLYNKHEIVDMIYFRNKSIHRTIKTINHYHVLVKVG